MASDCTRSDCRSLIKDCFRGRLSSPRFLSLFQAFKIKHPASTAAAFTEILLDVGCRGTIIDSRLPIYIEALLDEKFIDASTLLLVVHRVRHDHGAALDPSLLDARDSAESSLQTVVLQLLTRKIANGLIEEESELFSFLKNLVSWMNRFPFSVTLGFLLSAALGCSIAQEVLLGEKAKSVIQNVCFVDFRN